MPKVIAAVLFATGVTFVFVVGAMLDVNVFDHYDRGLGRGISVSILSSFAPMAALVSTPSYVITFVRLRFIPTHIGSLVAGSLVSVVAWLLTWASIVFVEYTNPITGWVAAASFILGGFVAALLVKRIHAPRTLPANP